LTRCECFSRIISLRRMRWVTGLSIVFVGGFFFVSNFVATVASAVVKLSE